jgi:hypothetical protein
MSEQLELLTTLMPSILAFSTVVTTYYKNQKNNITFGMSILKVVTVSVSFIYLLYLYFFKNQIKRESFIKTLLIQNIITLIFSFYTVYLIYKEYINKQINVVIHRSENILSTTKNNVEKTISTTENILKNKTI